MRAVTRRPWESCTYGVPLNRAKPRCQTPPTWAKSPPMDTELAPIVTAQTPISCRLRQWLIGQPNAEDPSGEFQPESHPAAT